MHDEGCRAFLETKFEPHDMFCPLMASADAEPTNNYWKEKCEARQKDPMHKSTCGYGKGCQARGTDYIDNPLIDELKDIGIDLDIPQKKIHDVSALLMRTRMTFKLIAYELGIPRSHVIRIANALRNTGYTLYKDR